MNKEQQIEEIEQFIYDYVDSKQTESVYLCSSRVNKLAKPFVHNKGIAEALYNAGYRKTFTSDFAIDTQKAYKEGYDKGFLDGREEFDIILQQNKQLLQARKISKSNIERLKTQLQQANAGIVNCSGCRLVELNAVKEFAEKLKINAIKLTAIESYHICEFVDELLKEYKND